MMPVVMYCNLFIWQPVVAGCAYQGHVHRDRFTRDQST